MHILSNCVSPKILIIKITFCIILMKSQTSNVAIANTLILELINFIISRSYDKRILRALYIYKLKNVSKFSKICEFKSNW